MTRKPRSHVRILKYRTRAIHAKSKTRFQLANKKISSGNVYMIQNCFKCLDCNSCLTFKLSTVCGTLKESALLISLIKLDRNHTRKEAIYIWSLTKRRKKTRKKFKQANRIITLDGGNSNLRKLLTNNITAETTKQL